MSNVPANINQGVIAKPDYLKDIPKDDNSDMKKHLSPPRLKVVQSQSGPPFKPAFKDADILLQPSMTKIGDQETEFTFVPIAFFAHWVCVNPYEMKGKLPFIREQSRDENSIIARKADRFVYEECPEDKRYQISYHKVFNFMIKFPGNPEITDVIGMSLMKGEFNSGRILINLIDSRDSQRHLCQFNGISKFRQGKKGNWFGLDFRNCPEPWLPEALIQQYKAEREAMEKLIAQGAIDIDLEDENLDSGDEAAATTKF